MFLAFVVFFIKGLNAMEILKTILFFFFCCDYPRNTLK